MINVSKLKRGIVIDHIRAGQGYKIFQQLGLDKLEDVVVLMRNVESGKLGRKDLIKIETDLALNFDVLGLIDPNVTITYVEDGERVQKVKLSPPQEVRGILACKNPRCVTNQERIENVAFRLVNPETNEYACEYCDARTRL
ncbi:MAG: Aspartate carbamoyltransferase regulatory chain [Firmicutes bacterium ADurb.Bin248]|nr:MAG: Aspartate carbamoyltransferase regulatory chain [Firmicutes bacterium ADurb.Bin248]HOG00248.1 aspartate carbamoyltransferase regulatory subunit [Clostridia bacterium]HPK14974.1 aspartate carbamoyltransferase regulatory subunit [Clostridia bacterium]